MPWTGSQFKNRHNKGLTPAQAKVTAKRANAILAETGNEGLAIATANKMAKRPKAKPSGKK